MPSKSCTEIFTLAEVFFKEFTFSVFTGNCQPALSIHRIIVKVFMMFARLAGLETLDNAMPKSRNPPDIRHHGHSQNENRLHSPLYRRQLKYNVEPVQRVGNFFQQMDIKENKLMLFDRYVIDNVINILQFINSYCYDDN